MNYYRKLLSVWLMCMTVALYSCDDSEKNVTQEVPTDEEVNMHSPELDLDFGLQTAILGLETQHVADILLAMHQLVPTHTSTVDDNTRLLLVPSLSEQFENEITKVYNQGGIIAVADPDEDNFKQWYEKHGWLECGLENAHFEHALMYSFGNGIHSHTIFEPNHEAISVEKDELDEMEDYGFNDKNQEELLFINRETLKPGQSRTSPALKYADKHIIYYTTIEGDVYRYSAYDKVYLKPGDSVQIYTSTDFKKQ